MTRTLAGVLVCVGMFLGCGGKQEPQVAGWTVLVYMVADNNLEPFAIPNLEQMAKVGSTDNLRFVVEVDRSLHYSDDPIGNIPASPTTKRLLVQNGSFQQLADLGNLDTANPATLADFIKWGVKNYPAKNYALVLWDHGGGWKGGFGLDETTGNMLSVAELQQAIKAGLDGSSVGKLQILGFDACLMSTFEVMKALQPYATYLIASEETEPGLGWNYTSFQPARDASAVEAVTLAKGIVDGYAAQNASERTITLAVTDLTKLAPLEAALSNFSTQIGPKLDTAALAIARSRAAALEFAKNPDPKKSYNLVDVGDFFRLLAQADAATFSALNGELDAALSGAVLYRKAGSAAANSRGVSIYFPATKATYDADGYAPLALPAWRSFLEAYLSMGATASVPTFSTHVARVSAGTNMLTVSAPLATGASASIVSASLFFGYSFPATSQSADEIAFYGDRPASFTTSTAFGSWDRKLATLNQGSTKDFAYLSIEPVDATTAAAVLPLGYLPPSASDCNSAGVGFALRQIVFATSNGQILSDRYFMEVSGAMSELKPQAGSHFKPVAYVLVGTQNFTRPATDFGWFCTSTKFAADQQISLAFEQPTVGSGVKMAFDLSIQNAGGKGDDAVVVGTF